MFRAGQDPKMMTEEEREIFFQRDESFTVSREYSNYEIRDND